MVYVRDMAEETYTIIGRYIGRPLGFRLNEARITAISDFPGVVVYTNKGEVYYSELYKGRKVHTADSVPVSRDDLTKAMQGLVELTTKVMASRGEIFFSVERALPISRIKEE